VKILITTIAIILICQNTYGQRTFNQLHNNNKFDWIIDSSSGQMTIYFEAESWTSDNLDFVRQRLLGQIDSTISFAGIEAYPSRIYFFIVESRSRMKDLVGWETNGTAFYKYNAVTGIGSDDLRSIFSIHELFHNISMNIWGIPEIWINEGMAVYSDGKWQGYDLDQLTKYLYDNNRFVSLTSLIKKFRKVDALVSYPLAGSFTKYLDETFGRDQVIEIWKAKSRKIKDITGKSIEELERDWLIKVQKIEYMNINY
jgi:hypothetical protein